MSNNPLIQRALDFIYMNREIPQLLYDSLVSNGVNVEALIERHSRGLFVSQSVTN